MPITIDPESGKILSVVGGNYQILVLGQTNLRSICDY